MAMLDALELSECLLSNAFSDPQAAIAHYEIQMRQRAAAVATLSLQQMEALHSPTALETMLEMFGSNEVAVSR